MIGFLAMSQFLVEPMIGPFGRNAPRSSIELSIKLTFDANTSIAKGRLAFNFNIEASLCIVILLCNCSYWSPKRSTLAVERINY